MTVFGLPEWLFWLIASLILLYAMIVIGLVLGKAGINPMWGLAPTVALLLPAWELPLVIVTLIALTIMLWRLAYCAWPAVDSSAPAENPASGPPA